MNKKDAIYITAIIILLIGGGILYSSYNSQVKKYEQCFNANQTLSKEKKELDELVKNAAPADLIEENVKNTLQNMLSEYDNLQSTNADMNDSIASQRQKIEQLLEDVEKYKGDSRLLYKAQKEAETLRNVMKSYVRTIDSLNIKNERLEAQIKTTTEELGVVKTEKDEIERKADKLEDIVEEGSLLQIAALTSEGIRVSKTGSQKPTTRALRALMIKSCFTAIANKISEKGHKVLYLRLIKPDGSVLLSPKNLKHRVNGRDLSMSEFRKIDYQGRGVDLCIYFKPPEQLQPGVYQVEIYTQGKKIGGHSLTLN